MHKRRMYQNRHRKEGTQFPFAALTLSDTHPSITQTVRGGSGGLKQTFIDSCLRVPPCQPIHMPILPDFCLPKQNRAGSGTNKCIRVEKSLLQTTSSTLYTSAGPPSAHTALCPLLKHGPTMIVPSSLRPRDSGRFGPPTTYWPNKVPSVSQPLDWHG